MKKRTGALESALVSLGLPDKEAAMYLALLELGRSTVSKISRKAGINRVTGYVILDSLVSKGLVQISGKEPKQEYVAESPDNLPALFRREREETERREKKAEALALELKSIQKSGNRPQVRFYEGAEGLRHVYDDTLTSMNGLRAFATFEDMKGSLGNYYSTYIKKRAAKGIFSRGIVLNTPEAAERKKHDKDEKRELVLIPDEHPSVFPEIDIYGDKVMIASASEKLGIIIESAGIAEAMRRIFDLAWERGKELETKKS